MLYIFEKETCEIINLYIVFNFKLFVIKDIKFFCLQLHEIIHIQVKVVSGNILFTYMMVNQYT